jgi:hypothetical protein
MMQGMNNLVVFLILLGAFPFLFPDEYLSLSRRIRAWLDQRARLREQTAARYREEEQADLARLEHDLDTLRPQVALVNRACASLDRRRGPRAGLSLQRKRAALNRTLTRVTRRLAEAKQKSGARPFDPAP